MVMKNAKIIGKPDLRIEEMYAIVARDENGDEGIMGASMIIEGQPMMMPLVGADVERVKQWIPKAKQLADMSGTSFRIFRFRDKEDVTEDFVTEDFSGGKR